MAFIYKITNDINNKVYVGKTQYTDVQKRFKEHCKDFKKRSTEKRPLYSAMKKYGVEHFQIEVIEQCENDKASEREIFWIKKLNTYKKGYNATIGGDGKGYIDLSQIIKLWNQGYCLKEIAISTNHDSGYIGKLLSLYVDNYREEVKQRSMNLFFQKVYDGYKIGAFDKDDKLVGMWSSAQSAVRELRPNRKYPTGDHIRAVLDGRRHSALGYVWKYVGKSPHV